MTIVYSAKRLALSLISCWYLTLSVLRLSPGRVLLSCKRCSNGTVHNRCPLDPVSLHSSNNGTEINRVIISKINACPSFDVLVFVCLPTYSVVDISAKGQRSILSGSSRSEKSLAFDPIVLGLKFLVFLVPFS